MLRSLAFVLSALAVSSASASEWNQFRGANAAGVADDATPPVEFGPGTAVLWKTAVQEGHSSPCVSKDRIFLTAVDKANKALQVIAVDRASGKQVWQASVTPEKLENAHAVSNPAATTSVSDGHRVYTYFGSYGVLAHEWDGKLAWETKLPLATPMFGTGASPVLAGDLLLVNRDYGNQPGLLAFRKSDGVSPGKLRSP